MQTNCFVLVTRRAENEDSPNAGDALCALSKFSKLILTTAL